MDHYFNLIMSNANKNNESNLEKIKDKFLDFEISFFNKNFEALSADSKKTKKILEVVSFYLLSDINKNSKKKNIKINNLLREYKKMLSKEEFEYFSTKEWNALLEIENSILTSQEAKEN